MPIVALIVYLVLLVVAVAAIAAAALAAMGILAMILVLLAVMALLGIVLFIWGLRKHRRWQWVTGLALTLLALVSAVAVVSLAGYGLYRGYQAWKPGAPENLASLDRQMRGSFESATGLTLPPEAVYVAGGDSSVLAGWLSQYRWKMRVPPEFAAVLDAKLEREPSGSLPSAFLALQKEHPDWGLVHSPDMACYTIHTGTVDTGGFTGALAIDKPAGMMYCAFEEYMP